MLFNHSAEAFEVNSGDRIAQLVVECVSNADCFEVAQTDNTIRGDGGFGSTGIAAAVQHVEMHASDWYR